VETLYLFFSNTQQRKLLLLQILPCLKLQLRNYRNYGWIWLPRPQPATPLMRRRRSCGVLNQRLGFGAKWLRKVMAAIPLFANQTMLIIFLWSLSVVAWLTVACNQTRFYLAINNVPHDSCETQPIRSYFINN
jgi:hypothetical protein